MMLPFILVEVFILLVFTLIDPSKSKGEIFEQDGVTYYRTICAHDSLTFYGIQLAYECCLVLAGCYLSFKTRKMKDDKFGTVCQTSNLISQPRPPVVLRKKV